MTGVKFGKRGGIGNKETEREGDREQGDRKSNGSDSNTAAARSDGGAMLGRQPARPAGDSGPWRCSRRREKVVKEIERRW